MGNHLKKIGFFGGTFDLALLRGEILQLFKVQVPNSHSVKHVLAVFKAIKCQKFIDIG